MVFPIAARKTLAATTVGCLLNLNPHPDKITTASHMRSLMEIVGQAFDLPFEEDGTTVVASALDVYKLWLCSATYQPSPVRDDPEFFTSRMLRHISMVFRPRTGAIDRHIQIGRKALDVYVQVAKEAGPLFSAETWTEFLKLYLAVADSLLSQAVDAVPLADQLQAQVLRVLFEIWFLSANQDEEVWGIWKSLMVNWRHRLTTITAWTSVLYGLVQRVLGISYGESVGAQVVTFTIADSPVSVEMDNDHVMYLMYKVLHLIGDLETIRDPGIYNEAIRGLGFLTTSLISSQNKIRNLGMIRPDGNSILHLLGPHLLEAITRFPRKLDHGKATALEAVTKLFLRKANQTDFHGRYLAMYYHGLEAALKSGSGHLLSTVLNSCPRLFGANFRGVNMLMPSFMAAVANVLVCRSQIVGVHGSMSLLRRSALAVLLQIISWPNHYSSLSFKARDPLHINVDSMPEIVSYEDLNPYIHFALINALETVVAAQNHGILFHTAFMYIVENIDRDVSFAKEFLADLLAMLIQGRWERASLMDVVHFLDDLASVVQILNADGSLSSSVVQCVCLVLSDAYDSSTMPESPADDLVCGLIHCLHRWIDGPWILAEQELLYRVWAALQMILQGSNGFHSSSEVAQEAALHCANFLLTRIGHMSDPEFPTSSQREDDLLEKYGLNPQDIMCFMMDGHLYSVLKKPKQVDQIQVTVIARTPGGTNAWDAALNYFPPNVQEVAQFDHDSTPVLPDLSGQRSLSQDTMDEMMDGLTEEQLVVHQSLEDTVEERLRIVDEVRNMLECESVVQPQERPAGETFDQEWGNVPSRMFLATMGFLSRNFVGRVSLFTPDTVPDVLDFVDRFDAIPVRESYSVGLVYVTKGLTSADDPLADFTEGSPLFQDFVNGLGTRTPVDKHPEFALDPSVVGPEIIIACDVHSAVAYVSPCWMLPEAAPEQEALLTSEMDVLVIWCEEMDETRLKTKAAYTIYIEPLPSQLYRIKVQMKSGGLVVGPLMDGAIVSKYALPMCLNRTVVNMCRGALGTNFLYGQSLAPRREALQDFFRDHVGQAPRLVDTWVTAVVSPEE